MEQVKLDFPMLSKPSKMPGYSINRDARLCHTGSKLRKVKGSTCENCYACKGRYNMPNVIDAMARREVFFNALDFVPRMVALLHSKRVAKHPEFRWFDSGDVDSVAMGLNILDVCDATPHLRHWIPSREYGIWAKVLKLRKLPDNVTLRMSATMIDGIPAGSWENTSTVNSKSMAGHIGHRCPAPQQGNKCADCRACWDRTVENVAYIEH